MFSERWLRILLRTSILLALGAAAVSFLALSGEYPGSTAAGRHWVFRDVVPLALIGWLHLRVLNATYSYHRANRTWIATAALVDVAMLAMTAPAALRGGAPVTRALPIIAILLLGSVLLMAKRSRELRSRDQI